MKKTILLTGAFGSVGKETLKELLIRKNEYFIKVIDIKSKANIKLYKKYKNDVSIYFEDLSKNNDLKYILHDVDFIIHLAGVIPPLADKNKTLAKKVNYEGTKHLVKQINKHCKNTFLLYSSSISVYGDRLNNPFIKVDDILSPSIGDYYAKTKIMAEKYIINHLKNWSIFRFSAIMSPLAKLNPLFFHMPLDTCIEIATTRDTSFALVQAINYRDQLQNRIFNLSGGEKCRVKYKIFLQKVFSLSNLGKFNLPKLAFAKVNFHCGYYMDSNILNNILNFQRDTIDDYYRLFEAAIPKIQLFFTNIFRKLIKKHLLSQSEPFQSLKNNDINLQNRFFGYEL